MKQERRYRLMAIQMLMLISIALLVALIGSWLTAQHEDEREALRKDLTAELDRAKQNIADSLIYTNFINPALGKMKVTTDVKFSINDTDSARIRMQLSKTDSVDNVDHTSLYLTDTTIGETDLEQIIQSAQNIKGFKSIDTITEIKKGKLKSKKIVYSTNDDETTRDVFGPVMVNILSNILETNDSFPKMAYTRMDTARFHSLFKRSLDERGRHFNITWIKSKQAYDEQPSELLIETNFYSKKYYVVAGNITPYLFKELSPQILFTLFLLLMTTVAYIVTYRTLKEQMKLGSIKNEFISNMSHELKTPISTVKVALEALTSYNVLSNPETTREYLHMAAHEMNRLDMLVNQSLNAALLEEGKIVLQKEELDVGRLARDTIKVLQLRLEQYHATVNLRTDGVGFILPADRLHLQGVLINLIDNSLKYNDKTPVIDISVKATDKQILVTVADNGPGIPQEYLGRVYDKFFRVPANNSHNVKGYGLGLNYAQQIVSLHGGSITVKNLPEGGCSFIITLLKR